MEDEYSKIEESQRRYFRSEKGKEALKKYHQSDKGKQKLKEAQKNYYHTNTRLAILYQNYLKENPNGTAKEFLASLKDEDE